MKKWTGFVAFIGAFCLFVPNFLAFAEPLEQFVVTIAKVELKKNSGEWITVIEPDRQVDLTRAEASVSFFNNGRRVPESLYDNVRLTLLGDITINGERRHYSNKGIVIKGLKNFSRPLEVKARSFIDVSFKLNITHWADDRNSAFGIMIQDSLEEVTMVADEQETRLFGKEIEVEV